MRFDGGFTSGGDSRLLAGEKFHAPTVALIAIMVFAMLVAAAAGLALANAAGLVARGAENRFVAVIPAAEIASLPRALAAASSSPGVASAEPVPEQEMRETLERWLGETAASSSDLPVPALLILELEPGADAAAVASRLRAAAPGVRLVSEAAELQPLLRSLRGLQWLAVALVLLMAAAAAAAVVLAARGALDTHRSTIEIMHGIGATDAQLTRLFERKIAVDVTAGAVTGFGAAALVLLLLGGGLAALSRDFALSAPLGIRDYIILALVPLGAIILAMAVAHWTLHRALREAI